VLHRRSRNRGAIELLDPEREVVGAQAPGPDRPARAALDALAVRAPLVVPGSPEAPWR
jgi:hypothetical protein